MLHCGEMKYKGNPNFAKKQRNPRGGMYAAAGQRFAFKAKKCASPAVTRVYGKWQSFTVAQVSADYRGRVAGGF
jgi:hypothetical protein